MISKKDIKQISPWIWEIPKKFKKEMKVPGRIYSSEKMIDDLFEDKSLMQLVNATTLFGIVKYAMTMPDAHQGFGVPIGGVGATEFPRGAISPQFVGFDQNCGMRLLKSNCIAQKIEGKINILAREIQRNIPSGVGKGRDLTFEIKEIDKILKEGAQALVNNNYGKKEDIIYCEAKGKMEKADPSVVSRHAKKRGKNQVGTLGSGNHFCEIDKVDEIFDKSAAKNFGLYKNQVVVMIHTGSRGLGHQICTDYSKRLKKKTKKYNLNTKLICAPFDSEEGNKFFKAMSCGSNYAWANRQMITYFVRKVWKKVIGKEKLELLYDVAHNNAKIEKHKINEKKKKLIVHRKGATRAFPPGHEEIPEKYKKTGQPVLIPGSMGTSSYVLKGVKSAKQSFYSTCHGAGRAMSRTQAKKETSGNRVKNDLKKKGIILKSHSLKGIAEEAPLAYKNINAVIEAVCNAGLSKKVVKLKPLAVIKGE